MRCSFSITLASANAKATDEGGQIHRCCLITWLCLAQRWGLGNAAESVDPFLLFLLSLGPDAPFMIKKRETRRNESRKSLSLLKFVQCG